MEALFELFRRLRTRVRDQVQTANKCSEQAVLEAGTSLQKIVELSQQQSVRYAELAAQVDSRDGLTGNVNEMAVGVRTYFSGATDAIKSQQADATLAQTQLANVIKAADSIAELTQAARILSFNARVEAARLGTAGAGFAVIASELSTLSKSIAAANDGLSGICEQLCKLLPRLGNRATQMNEQADAFVHRLQEQLSGLDDASRRLSARLGQSLDASKQSIAQTLEQSHGALSALQFHDPVSQDLNQLDLEFHQSEQSLPSLLGLPASPLTPLEPLQTRLGDAGGPVTAESGAVLLF